MYRLLFLIALPLYLFSQDTITGKIVDNQLNPLFNATVHWIGTTQGSTTDKDGNFKITTDNIEDYRLIISFIGFQADTVIITNQNTILTKLEPSNTLNAIELTENASGIYIDKSKALKIETIKIIILYLNLVKKLATYLACMNGMMKQILVHF